MQKPIQLDLFSAATLPPMGHQGTQQPAAPKPAHGGYPQTTAGSNGTSAAPIPTWPFGSGTGTLTGSTTLPANGPSTFAQQNMHWGTITIGTDGQFVVSSAEVETIEDYSFTFTDGTVQRKAILAPEYDITPLETLKLSRLMNNAPMNLNKLQYVKNNNLLRHFRLE